MRHRVAGRPLNADTQHRLAMRRNSARSLFISGRIVTSLAKAKAFRRFVEKLITRARRAVALRDSGDASAYLHQVRVLAQDVPDKAVLRRLLTDVAPACKDRPGGYTRIVRDWKNQVGDNAPRAIFELVDRPPLEGSGEDAEAAEGADAEKGGAGKGRTGRKGGKPAPATPKGSAKTSPKTKTKTKTKRGAKEPAAAPADRGADVE